MSRLVEVFRQISQPMNNDNIPETTSFNDSYPATDIDRYSESVSTTDIDRYSESKAIELQLNQSISLQDRKKEELKTMYQARLQVVLKDAQEQKDQISSIMSKQKNHLIKLHLEAVLHQISESTETDMKVLDEQYAQALLTHDTETKLLTQSIYKSHLIDSLILKLNNPSFDLELGLALGILLHHDNSYCPDDDDMGKDSEILLRRYFTKEVSASGEHTQKLFEEHLISKARTTLLNMLHSKATPFGSKRANYVITPKPSSSGIKLTDTDIRHSFMFEDA
jgi:hypothetical protein